jgi:hypothetical protein
MAIGNLQRNNPNGNINLRHSLGIFGNATIAKARLQK